MWKGFFLSSLLFAQGNGGVGDYENMSLGLKATGQVKTLKITKNDGKNISFELVVGSGTCQGELTAKAKIIAKGKAQYKKKKCVIDFVERESGWFVEETGDCDEHGAACNFTGLFSERP